MQSQVVILETGVYALDRLYEEEFDFRRAQAQEQWQLDYCPSFY